ncbi:MAG: aminoglycoside phosphotransferase family protein [Candidatus Binataceae bacterium]
MGCNSGAIETWAKAAIERRWPGAQIRHIKAIRGDASDRRFWRISIAAGPRAAAPATAILIDLGPHDLPAYARILNLVKEPLAEPPWVNVHRLFVSIGAPVPSLYECDPARRAMLVEDVGELSLSNAARRPGANAADLFRLAADELIRIHVEGTRKAGFDCVARSINYDSRLFEWEMREFLEVGLAAVAPGADSAAIRPELAMLAAGLDKIPRVLSHRDYHGSNLFVQPRPERSRKAGPRLRIVDFQDALMAPAAQDLAVLLTTRDADEIVTPAIERRILDFYLAGLARRKFSAPGESDFIAGYRLCVLQHALKTIGRFEAFERGGKPGYRVYVPHALAQARRMLAAMPGEFPALRAALGA